MVGKWLRFSAKIFTPLTLKVIYICNLWVGVAPNKLPRCEVWYLCPLEFWETYKKAKIGSSLIFSAQLLSHNSRSKLFHRTVIPKFLIFISDTCDGRDVKGGGPCQSRPEWAMSVYQGFILAGRAWSELGRVGVLCVPL